MLKGKLQSELFYCDHLGVSEHDEQDIMSFTIRDTKGSGLLQYIRYFAFPEEDEGVMRTYIVRDKRSFEMVGYFSLKAGLISYNERDIPVIDEVTGEVVIDEATGERKMRRVFDTLPGVELADFAVNQKYIDNHPDLKGVGLVIYNSFILPVIKEAAETIGIKILYLFALPYDDLIHRYETYGFSRLEEELEVELHKRLKPHYGDSCKFMFRML